MPGISISVVESSRNCGDSSTRLTITDINVSEDICLVCLAYKYSHEQCHCCVDCCQCRLCLTCGSITEQSLLCRLCWKCKDCCRCALCKLCGKPHDATDMLCPRCGGGRSLTCGCCSKNGSRVPRFRTSVDLLRYNPTRHQLAKNPTPRLISVELEVGGTGCGSTELISTLQKWNCSVVSDGSLPSGGFEINTHPAGGDLFVDQVKDICAGFEHGNTFIQGKCGGHTHVDARDLDYAAMARLIRLYACCEHALYAIIPEHRRVSHYCQMWAMNYLFTIRAYENIMKDGDSERKRMLKYRKAILKQLYGYHDKKSVKKSHADKGGVNGTRYRGFNLHSWMYRGTVEFRMPPGSIIYDNIVNWGILLANMVDLAVHNNMGYIRTLTEKVEQEAVVQSKYGTDWYGVYYDWPKKCAEESFNLLKAICPTQEIHDWVIERKKWYANTIHQFEAESSNHRKGD